MPRDAESDPALDPTLAPGRAQSGPSEAALGIGGGLLSVLGPLSVAVLTPAYPEMQARFGASAAQVSNVATAFFLGFAGAQLVCGMMSDALGRRRVGLGFLALFVLTSVLCLSAASIGQLLALRVLQGIGAAVGIATARALVRDRFTGLAAARVINLMYLVLGVGPALAPLLGGLLVETVGFRGVFAFLALYGAALAAFLALLAPDPGPPDIRRLRLDLLAGTFRRLVSSRSYLAPALAIAGVSGALYGQSALLPFVLMDELGLSTGGFALAFACVALCHVAGSLSARFWIPRLAPGTLVRLAAGTILTAAALLALGTMARPSVLGLIGPIALAAFAGSHSYPILVTASVEDFARDAGAASALLGCLQMTAGFVVATVAGLFAPSATVAALALGASLAAAGTLGLSWALREDSRTPDGAGRTGKNEAGEEPQ